MKRCLLVVGLGLLALGCEPEPDVEPLPCRNVEAGTAELGAGDLSSGFVPLSDGGRMMLSLGPQGQHMLTVSIRVSNLEMPSASARRLRTTVAVVKDGDMVGGTVSQLAPTSQGGMSEFLGLRAIITADEIAPLMDGTTKIEGAVTDGCGRELPAEKIAQLAQ